MLKAREAVFWPGISNDICEAVKKCENLSSKFQRQLNLLEMSVMFHLMHGTL